MMLHMAAYMNTVSFFFLGDVDDASHGCIHEYCLIFLGDVDDASHGCLHEYCLIFVGDVDDAPHGWLPT